MENQHNKIINHIKQNGSITSLEGFPLGITKVSTRISELRRKGYEFDEVWEESETSRYKRYFLKKEA